MQPRLVRQQRRASWFKTTRAVSAALRDAEALAAVVAAAQEGEGEATHEACAHGVVRLPEASAVCHGARRAARVPLLAAAGLRRAQTRAPRARAPQANIFSQRQNVVNIISSLLERLKVTVKVCEKILGLEMVMNMNVALLECCL